MQPTLQLLVRACTSVPVVGVAFTLVLLVGRSVIHAVAEVLAGREPVSVGEKTALSPQMSQAEDV